MSLKSLAKRIRDSFVEPLEYRLQVLEDSLAVRSRESRLDQERQARRYDEPLCLTRHGYRNFSQFDEDGLIDETLRRIGVTGRFFVEFGVGTGLENNTVALLLQGWKGLWIEADPASCGRIREDFREPLESGQLTLRESFVTAENIEECFERAGVPPEPDVLGIDIDGNDFWVWKAIDRFRPRVVVIEYNASLGRSARIVRPYDPSERWDQTTCTGASLGALEDLGRTKGYALVGCCLAGVNAIFVRSDLVHDRFLAPFTAEKHYEPPPLRPERWRAHPTVGALPLPLRSGEAMRRGAAGAPQAGPCLHAPRKAHPAARRPDEGRRELGWTATTRFEDLVTMMVDAAPAA